MENVIRILKDHSLPKSVTLAKNRKQFSIGKKEFRVTNLG